MLNGFYLNRFVIVIWDLIAKISDIEKFCDKCDSASLNFLKIYFGLKNKTVN